MACCPFATLRATEHGDANTNVYAVGYAAVTTH